MTLSNSLRINKITTALIAVLGLSVVSLPATASGYDASNQSVKSANGEQARSNALAAIKKATLPFTDVNNALDAGYVSTVDLGFTTHVEARSPPDKIYQSMIGTLFY